MKQHKLSAICIVLACMLTILTACEKKNDIVGTWEAGVNVVGLTNEAPPTDNRVILYFMEDLTGKEELIINGECKERVFTYTVADDEIQIQFESETTWVFPFELDDDLLILTQNHQRIPYSRVK